MGQSSNSKDRMIVRPGSREGDREPARVVNIDLAGVGRAAGPGSFVRLRRWPAPDVIDLHDVGGSSGPIRITQSI